MDQPVPEKKKTNTPPSEKRTPQYIPARGNPSENWADDPVLAAEAARQRRQGTEATFNRYYSDNEEARKEHKKLIEAQKSYKPFNPASWEDFARGVGNGVNNLGYSAYDLVGHDILGATTAKESGMELDYFGEQDTALGALTSGAIQFLIPFGAAVKGGRAFQGLRGSKARGSKELKYSKSSAISSRKYLALALEGAAVGAAADFVAWHPEQGNFSGYLNDWLKKREEDGSIEQIEKTLPNLREFIHDFAQVTSGVLAVDPLEPDQKLGGISRIENLQNRFKNMGEGVFMGAAMNLMLHAIKSGGIRASSRYHQWKLKKHWANKKYQTGGSTDAGGGHTAPKQTTAEWDAKEREILDALRKRREQLESLGAEGALNLIKETVGAGRDWNNVLNSERLVNADNSDILVTVPGWGLPPSGVRELVDRAKFPDNVNVEYGKGRMRASEVDAPKFDDWVKTSDDPAAVAFRNESRPGDPQPTFTERMAGDEGPRGEGFREELGLTVEAWESALKAARKPITQVVKGKAKKVDAKWVKDTLKDLMEEGSQPGHPALSDLSHDEFKALLESKGAAKKIQKLYDDYLAKHEKGYKEALAKEKDPVAFEKAESTAKIKKDAEEAYRAAIASTPGKRVGATLKAPGEDGKRTLLIDEAQLREDFENKAWMKPQVEGVTPLGATEDLPKGDPNMFRSAEDYIAWVLEHEKAHLEYPLAGKGFSKGDYENKINQIATERWNAARRPDPPTYKGKVLETHSHTFSGSTQQLVGSDGKRILVDQDKVVEDFVNGMAFMKGNGYPEGLNIFSQRERAIADFMNLDVSKLEAQFKMRSRLKTSRAEAGSDIYAKFLELRQARMLSLFEKEGIDLLDPKVPMQDITIKRLLAEANYDTLTKDLAIDPKSVASIKGGELMRHGLPTEKQQVFEQLFVKENSDGRTGIQELEHLTKRMNDPKDPLTLEQLEASLSSDKIFNLRLEGGGHASTTDSLAALVFVFRNTFTSPSVKKGEHGLAIRQNWDPEYGGDPKTFNRNKIEKEIEDFAATLKDSAGNPMSKEDLLHILKTGEGGFGGRVERLSDEALKAESIHDLSTGDASELYARILAARHLFIQRTKEFDKIAKNYLRKKADNNVSMRDMQELQDIVEKLVQDGVGLRHARRDWGRQGLSFQELYKLAGEKGISKESVDDAVAAKVLGFEFGGKKGEEAYEELVETTRLQSESDTGLLPEEKARVTWEHVAKGSVRGFALDLWISGLLSGLRTLSVNTVGTGIKAVSMPLGRIVGSVLNNKEQTSVLGRLLDPKEANSFARTQAFKQLHFTALMLVDFWRIMARTSDKNIRVQPNAMELGEGVMGQLRGGPGAPTTEDAFRATGAALKADNELVSVAAGKGAEGSPLADVFKDNIDRGSAAALGGGIARTLSYIPGVSKEAGKNFVNKVVDHLNKASGMDLINKWNGLYHSTLKQGTRKMLLTDEMWKQIIARSYIKSTLAAEAVSMGMRDNRQIAEFVHRYGEGMLLSSGELFSLKNLRKQGIELYSKEGLPPDQLNKTVDLYVDRLKDIREGDIIIMSAERREAIAKNILREIEEATFTTPLNRASREAFEARTARGDRGLRNPNEGSGWGNVSSRVQDLVNIDPISQYLTTPFVRITSNLWKELGANQPFVKELQDRYWADLYSGDPSRVALAHGRQFVGSMLFGGAAVLAANGLIRGRGPSDPKANKLWRDMGNVPYSFVVPWSGYQLEFGRLDPLAAYLELAADLQENYYYARTDEEANFWVNDFAEAVAGSLGESLLNNTYTKDLSELYEIMLSTSEEDPTNRIEEWLKQKLVSTTPNILEGFTGSVDTKVRQIRSNMDALMLKMYPYGVPPKRHRIFGNILERTEIYPNRFIHAFTPIKVHKPVKNDPFEIEMVSLNAELQGMQSREWGNPFLDKTRFFAVTEPFEPKPAANEKTVPKWRMDQYNKEKRERKWLKENFFRIVSGGKDNTHIKEGQDLYDFTSHYISVRRQKWVAPDIAGEILREIKDKEGKEYDEIRKWGNAIIKGKSGSLTLKEILTAAIEHPSYKKISRHPDEYANVKSYRLEIIRGIVQKFRNDAWEELLGDKINIAAKGSKHKNVVGRGGIISAFYKDYAYTRVLINRQSQMRRQQQYQDDMPIGPDAEASTPNVLKEAIENIPR